jgi:hypothetical protein
MAPLGALHLPYCELECQSLQIMALSKYTYAAESVGCDEKGSYSFRITDGRTNRNLYPAERAAGFISGKMLMSVRANGTLG